MPPGLPLGCACSSALLPGRWVEPMRRGTPWAVAVPRARADGALTTWTGCRLSAVVARLACLSLAAAQCITTRTRPRPFIRCHTPAVTAARRDSPTRLPRCVMRPCCGRMEEERRLAGPGLGGMVLNVVLTKVEGRPIPCQAAPSTTTAGGGGEWARKRRSLRGPPDVRPRPPMLSLPLLTIIIGRRV